MLEKTSIYIDSDKIPFFEIYILQVQIINKLLMIFLTASIKLEKGFHFKFSIELYKKNKMRNFENSLYINKEIDFYLSLKDFESGEVITLTSQEEFDEEDRVVIKEISNDEYEMKVLNNDNKILDTQENKKKIENNEIIDFSNSSYNYDINKYYIESSSKGCQFNLKSKINISENYQNIILNFFEKNNKKNNVNAQCTLSSDNKNNILCFLEQEIENKNCLLKNYVGSSENSLFYIMQDKNIDNIKLNCFEQKYKNSKKIIIIVVLSISGIAVISLITVCICCCKNKKEEQIIQRFKSKK